MEFAVPKFKPGEIDRAGRAKRAKRVSNVAIVAQRLKRFESIASKLVREPNMKLSQMQDLGGCSGRAGMRIAGGSPRTCMNSVFLIS
jgi:ppGpp synthetase/RelA/SpoT-type nucleotidyltranferase